MSARTRQALIFLAIAAFLGLAADALTSNLPARADLAAWILMSLLAGLVLVRTGIVRVERASVIIALIAVPFILALVGRDSEALFTLNLLVALTCIVLAAPKAHPASLPRAGVTDYAFFGATSAGSSLIGVLPLVATDVRWSEVRFGGRARPLAAVAIGLVAVAPVLLLFGTLFSQADPLFARAMHSIFNVDLTPLMEHIVRIGATAWLIAGFLRWSFTGDSAARWLKLPGGGIGATAVVTALAAVAGLFLLFVAVEARYLFGGEALVRSLTGLSYAEYARRGFFELTWVAGLSVPLLLLADWALDQSQPAAVRRFRVVAWSMLLLLGVIVASALYRMGLYTDAYGLTELRLYTTAFMIWLAVVLVWLGATVLRGRRNGFAFGAVVAGLAAVAVLNVINPDALIARTDLQRKPTAEEMDIKYLGGLSADAVPTLVAAFRSLAPAARCALATRLESRWSRRVGHVWNLGRVAAADDIATAASLAARDCRPAGS